MPQTREDNLLDQIEILEDKLADRDATIEDNEETIKNLRKDLDVYEEKEATIKDLADTIAEAAKEIGRLT